MTAARQAGCVAIGTRALLIEGPPGSGKSSLALALIDRGARLIGDDSVVLERRGRAVIASPHPRTKGLIEIRNLGLVEMAVAEAAPVCLVLQLDDNAPRYLERPGEIAVEGTALPLVRLWPHDPILPLKAEIALDRFGLSPG